MTREYAIEEVKFLRDAFSNRAEECEKIGDLIPMDLYARTAENLDGVLRFLRPITREQVEKMLGTWIEVSDVDGCTWSKCSDCQEDLDSLEDAYDFCPYCGAPMTDKAVDILWKRLEAMQDE